MRRDILLEDRPDDRQFLKRLREDFLELVSCGRAAEIQVVAEIGRKPCDPGEDREGEARHDLVRAQRDNEEGVDGRQELAACGERFDARTGAQSAPFGAAMTTSRPHHPSAVLGTSTRASCS